MNKNIWIIFFILILTLLTVVIYWNKPVKQANKSETASSANSLPEIKSNQESKPEPEKITEYQVPILMYHYIRDYNDPNDEIDTKLSVSPNTFDQQLKWLKDNGYQTVNFDYLLNPYSLSLKPIILTFDDGYRDAYEQAFPILKKYGFTATFYLITRDVGNPYYMTWEMAKEMKDNKMIIAAHSVSHPDLSKATDEQIESQIKNSKEKIESELGITVTDFCYPSGKYDERVISKLKENGYKTAVTTKTGISNQDSDLFELPRLRIQNDSDLATKLAQ